MGKKTKNCDMERCWRQRSFVESLLVWNGHSGTINRARMRCLAQWWTTAAFDKLHWMFLSDCFRLSFQFYQQQKHLSLFTSFMLVLFHNWEQMTNLTPRHNKNTQSVSQFYTVALFERNRWKIFAPRGKHFEFSVSFSSLFVADTCESCSSVLPIELCARMFPKRKTLQGHYLALKPKMWEARKLFPFIEWSSHAIWHVLSLWSQNASYFLFLLSSNQIKSMSSESIWYIFHWCSGVNKSGDQKEQERKGKTKQQSRAFTPKRVWTIENVWDDFPISQNKLKSNFRCIHNSYNQLHTQRKHHICAGYLLSLDYKNACVFYLQKGMSRFSKELQRKEAGSVTN